MNWTLTPRQESILVFLKDNPGASTNKLCVMTSPACLAQGRTRTMSTYGWKTPGKMAELGLLQMTVDNTLVNKGIARDMAIDKQAGKVCKPGFYAHKYRYSVRYQWELTPAGHLVADYILKNQAAQVGLVNTDRNPC